MVSLLGIERAEERLKQAELSAIDALSAFGSEADTLRAAAHYAAARGH
jgi:hypothetical protein